MSYARGGGPASAAEIDALALAGSPVAPGTDPGMRQLAAPPWPVTAAEVASLRGWLAGWGDGPHWQDPSGQTVPIAKVTLRRLLDEIDRLTAAAKP